MTRKFQLFSLFALLFVTEGVCASVACVEFFASSSERREGTNDLIAYLATLLEQQIIDEAELHRVVVGLEAGEFVNPITSQRALANTAALLHRNEIQEYIDTTELDQDEILRWAKQNLHTKEGVKVRRDETRVETEDVHHKMVFYPIPPGKFEMGEKGKTVSVELTHTIEMMSTLVTQKHWIDLMDENPSHFKGLDNPVENVTWWSAIVFANELSKMHGLKPAYDISGILFSGHEKDGTLSAEHGKLKISAPNGDIYLTEGFRLPTEAEQEYVRRSLGQATGKYFFGESDTELEQYAWFYDNSQGKTHPVAELKPLVISGQPFFDLLGNVDEWGYDFKGGDLKGGINPTGIAKSSYRVIRGGSWSDDVRFLRSANRTDFEPDDRFNSVGFRLVRTIK